MQDGTLLIGKKCWHREWPGISLQWNHDKKRPLDSKGAGSSTRVTEILALGSVSFPVMAADGQPNQFDPRMQVAFEEAMGVRESSWKSVRYSIAFDGESKPMNAPRCFLTCGANIR